MAKAIKAKDLPDHQEWLATRGAQKRGKKQAGVFRESLQSKSFSALTGQEKDSLLKAIALELGMIAPD